MMSLEDITIFGINELEEEEISPESAKVWEKSSDEGKMAVESFEDTKGGKEEEAKLELTYFAKCQKERKEEEPERLNFLRRKTF